MINVELLVDAEREKVAAKASKDDSMMTAYRSELSGDFLNEMLKSRVKVMVKVGWLAAFSYM